MTNIDFLGIGVQKSATSWLYDNLRDHPDIWMPPRKELHYFDRNINYLSPNFLATNKYADRLKGTEEHNVLFRKKMNDELRFASESGNLVTFEWLNRYFCQDISDKWYNSLFAEGRGKVKGEITPAYSILSVKDIRHIKELFPNLKLILLLRNPVERAWSQVRFLIKTGRLNKSLTIEEMIKFIDSPFQVSRSDYFSILSRWKKVFPSTQFFIGFYDEVIESPRELLSSLYVFLKTDPIKSSFKNLSIKSNASPIIEMPAEIREYLIVKYTAEIEKLISIHHSPYFEKWLGKYKSSI